MKAPPLDAKPERTPPRLFHLETTVRLNEDCFETTLPGTVAAGDKLPATNSKVPRGTPGNTGTRQA